MPLLSQLLQALPLLLYLLYVYVHKGIHLYLALLHMVLFAFVTRACVLNWQRSVRANEKTKWPPVFPALLPAPAAVYSSFCLHVETHVSARTCRCTDVDGMTIKDSSYYYS